MWSTQLLCKGMSEGINTSQNIRVYNLESQRKAENSDKQNVNFINKNEWLDAHYDFSDNN